MSFAHHSLNYITFLTSPAIDGLGGLKHMFTTRLGGVSRGALQGLNLGTGRNEPLENILENYRLACGAIGIDYTKCVLSKQTHGTNIRLVTSADCGKGLVRESDITDADALVTSEMGVPIAVFFADCVPILLYDPVTPAVAAVHAGWRGTVAGIGAKTVAFMSEHFGSKPQDIIAAIGPSIGACCFETGAEVASEFEEAGLGDAVVERYCVSVHNDVISGGHSDPPLQGSHMMCEDGQEQGILEEITNEGKRAPQGTPLQRNFQIVKGEKCRINLWQANVMLLTKVGLLPQNISVAEECTCCNPQMYFSHRACGADTGRMALIAEL